MGRSYRAFLSAWLLFLAFVLFWPRVSLAQGKPDFRLKNEHVPVCPGPEKDGARCLSRVIVNQNKVPITSTVPFGYGPAQLRGGYNLSGTASANTIIAVVDAYDDPNALSDLNVYSQTFGLPIMSSCPVAPSGSTSSLCFQKVSQFGNNRLPRSNSGWALEISLDVQVAHAICQNCNILLVEARSASYSDLLTAIDRARMMGAKIISNSWSSGEFPSEVSLDSHFNFPGVMFTFASGDGGYGSQYPAASRYVTAVGGTTLFVDSNNNYLSESAWSGTGSGCSLYESKPSWQTDSLCSTRTIADVSAVADPNTGAAVYDSFGYFGQAGWFQVGGTSLATPLIAGVYALNGNVPGNTVGAALPYGLVNYSSNLHDVTSGSNGSCGGTYLCTALAGFDGPTGLGSPNGVGAF